MRPGTRLTPEDAVRMSAADEVVQLVIHPALLPRVVDLLNRSGGDMVCIPTEPDDLPTFIWSPWHMPGREGGSR